MVISLIAIGKRMPGWVEQGYHDYAKRFTADFSLKLIEIPIQKRGNKLDIARAMRQESDQMLAAIPKNNFAIALDIAGEQWDTHQLAHNLEQWQQHGYHVSLMIGGPEGLSSDCLARADKKWSLSLLTFPHPLVRILVAEQLYRAWSILAHHPYHRN